MDLFELHNVKDRQIENLSGGELQRFACAMVCIQKGDIFMFDEPSSYLDVKQRLKAALAIRDIIRETRFVVITVRD
jgi:ATP-binding cassette, sub-family E, member 1